jgi:hypothetical protein
MYFFIISPCAIILYFIRNYDIDTENVWIYVYFNVMQANCTLQLKNIAGFGINKFALKTVCVFGVDMFNQRTNLLVTALQTGRSRDRIPMASLESFIYIILPAALWTWGRLSL